jgi:hypothetical protein
MFQKVPGGKFKARLERLELVEPLERVVDDRSFGA